MIMELEGVVNFVLSSNSFPGCFYFFDGGCHRAQENNDRPKLFLSVVENYV